MADAFLDDHGLDGANTLTGVALEDPATTDCGWVFGGYAMPLLDPVENHAREDAYALSCADTAGWTKYLDYHVKTTSTCTVYLRDSERWRIYVQEAQLWADEDPDTSTPQEADSPLVHPDVTTPSRFPGYAVWAASGRFSADYIGFVDSPDGGLTFPVYAPVMAVAAFAAAASDPTRCVSSWDTTLSDFTNAGWTSTIIPCRTSVASADLVYSVYRDATVVDLYREWGIYLMLAVEGRATAAITSTTVNAAFTPATDACEDMPYTRVVFFASTSPDFPTNVPATGPFTWPEPTDHLEAVVAVQPDSGADGPIVGAQPNEWYGVPHMVLTPDRTTVLVYVPWLSVQDTTCLATILPTRVTDVYDGGLPAWAGGALATTGNGISVFGVPTNLLALLLWWTAYADADSSGSWLGLSSTELRELIRLLVLGNYRGEVLITDGPTWVASRRHPQLRRTPCRRWPMPSAPDVRVCFRAGAPPLPSISTP